MTQRNRIRHVKRRVSLANRRNDSELGTWVSFPGAVSRKTARISARDNDFSLIGLKASNIVLPPVTPLPERIRTIAGNRSINGLKKRLVKRRKVSHGLNFDHMVSILGTISHSRVSRQMDQKQLYLGHNVDIRTDYGRKMDTSRTSWT
jgi:hypothetical protein